MFGELTKLTSLRSLYLTCSSRLVEHMTAFKHLTELQCTVQIRSDAKTERPQFDALTNLKKLQICGNNRIMNMAQLTQLEVLKLFDAEFEEINSLQNFNSLTQLEIGTSFNSKTVDFSFQMPNIKYLSLRYISKVSEAFLRNFPNLTTYKIRGTFILPPQAEKLTKLSLGSINYTKDNMDVLATLTNLMSLKLQGRLVKTEEYWNLPTTLRELSIEESYGSNVNILPYLTKLGNLERVTLREVTPMDGSDVEQEIKQFLKAMPQLKYVSFKGICCTLLTFHKHKSWFNYLRKNKIYADIEFE